MNKKEIEELIKFVSKAGVSEVSLEMKDIKITIKNTAQRMDQVVSHIPAPAVLPIALAPVSSPPVAITPPATKVETPKQTGADESKYLTIKSPMIGTFYRSSSPDKPNFVNVGDEITPGKPICIIEAMKLFNEIESENTGRIIKVLVENSSPVEYDQPLFIIDPS